jgi:hypothetical protein
MRMRRLSLSVALLAVVAACATVDPMPSLKYADAASRGSVAAFFVGSPSQEAVKATTAKWSEALGDSVACNVPMRQVLDAGLVGALEIGAMSAASTRGDEKVIRRGVAGYLLELASLVTKRRPAPEAARCQAISAWAPRIAEEGRETVARARKNGVIGKEYDLLIALVGR